MVPAPFWSDDFDMDLLKLWPELPEMLGEAANTPLWTLGHETNGRLNHPVCWNASPGPVAFFWLERPKLTRSKHGWVTLANGCTTDNPLVEAIWLEVLRDAWPHHYAIVLDRRILWNVCEEQQRFMDIMYALRGVHKRDVTREKAEVWANIRVAHHRLMATLADRELAA